MSVVRLFKSTLIDLGLVVLIAAGGEVLHAVLMRPHAAADLVLLRGLHHVGVPLDRVGLQSAHERAAGRWRYELSMTCSEVPADDDALAEHVRAVPDTSLVRATREPAPGDAPAGGQRVQVRFTGPAGLERPD